MTIRQKLALTATITLAITFTLTACGEHTLEDIFGLGSSSSEEEEYYSSSSLRQSSSSLQQSSSSPQLGTSSSSNLQQSSSSSQLGISSGSSLQQGSDRGTFTDTRNNKTYKTTKIGDQVWMAENLNIETGTSVCYNNDPANCTKYGRLYDWTTAMELPPSCNSSTCASRVSTKHRGICPSGWHIPSDADWNVLMKFVNPSCKDNDHCAEAGAKLKSVSGWDDNGNGTDNFDFTALPGGGYSEGDFYGIGYYGNWWSASEIDAIDAYSRSMNYSRELVSRIIYSKEISRSVRCIKD